MAYRCRAEQIDNDVQIICYQVTSEGHKDRAEYTLTPSDALEFAMGIVHAANGAHRSRTLNAATGECGTCNNQRMVYRPATLGGYSDDRGNELIHCPDCGDRFKQADGSIPVPGDMVILKTVPGSTPG